MDTEGSETDGGVAIDGGAGEEAGDDDSIGERIIFIPRRLAPRPLPPLSDARRPEPSTGGGSMAAKTLPSTAPMGWGAGRLGRTRGKLGWGADAGSMAKEASGGARTGSL